MAVKPKIKATKRMLKADVEEMFRRFKEDNPEPKSDLEYTNTYTLLVAVTLSAQATDVSVNKATKDLFKIVATPEDMVKLGEEKLIEYIRSIGLYKTKAKNVIKTAYALIEDHKSQVPNDSKALQKLAGVGRKTANVVQNVAFGEPTIAVDTHIFRLSNRLGLAKGSDVLAVEQGLAKVIPSPYVQDSHHWLILHGRYVCKARKPVCENCIIYDLCNSHEKIHLDNLKLGF